MDGLFKFELGDPTGEDPDKAKPEFNTNDQKTLIRKHLPTISIMDIKESREIARERGRFVDFRQNYDYEGNFAV